MTSVLGFEFNSLLVAILYFPKLLIDFAQHTPPFSMAAASCERDPVSENDVQDCTEMSKMAAAGCDMGSVAWQSSEHDAHQCTDTDTVLSDYPDDLSEWSQARNDVHAKGQYSQGEGDFQAESRVEMEKNAPTDQELQPEVDMPMDQLSTGGSTIEGL